MSAAEGATTRVAVIGGGTSSEHDVSNATADSISTTLAGLDEFEVLRMDITRCGGWQDADGSALDAAVALGKLARCEVLFGSVHGPGGEDGTLAALASLLGVAVVGSGLTAGALAMDKWVTKLVAAEVGVQVAAGRLVRPDDLVTWEGPVVVKPVAAGSSNGVSLVREPGDLEVALKAAFAEDDRVLVEEVVEGREIDVAVLRRADGTLLVTPALEVHVDGFFDYDAKYGGSDGTRFEVPAPITGAERAELERQAVDVFEALGCAGVARVDFFLTERGWVLNEVNTVPGMTATSQVPLMAAAAGMTYAELLSDLVRSARVR
ncbi:D-alanine--D-alanine ligase family protein [Nocardioides yefusunii]|uniref:D-alanine--D-alanine ligase n=1 Tax=Nocardioides yefusunii TaxID=2500546 RepID=A0ABW1QTI4_9ACTN|nr:D-alanine--D-alanine ligase [Nocardioides yefusunii]